MTRRSRSSTPSTGRESRSTSGCSCSPTTTLLAAVIAAQKRGVNVRVMLNPARRSGEAENEASRKTLTDAGIEVRDSNPKFDLTHQKSMVIDDAVGFVESLNWEPKDLTEDARLRRGHDARSRSAGDGGVLRRRLGAARTSAAAGFETDLVSGQRPPTRRGLHRRSEGHAVGAERALSGHRDHRTARARGDARREGAHPHEEAALAEARQAHRRRRRLADPAGRRREGAHHPPPQAARQDDARRRQARDRRFDQSRAGQFRLAPRTRDRDRPTATS